MKNIKSDKISDVKKNNFNHFDDFLLTVLNNCFCEITVTDIKGSVLYSNPMCYEYHGLSLEKMYKTNFLTSYQGYWSPPSTSYAIEKRRTIFAHQKSMITGEKHITVATPVFDDDKEIQYIVHTTLKTEPYIKFDIDYLDSEKNTKQENFREISKQKNNIVGRSYSLYSTLNKLYRGAKSDIPILLLGETGVGKSTFAKYVHDNSLRADHPFISVNCASIPENLIESELFGYVPYAFTGANPKGKKGLVELADKGTLFLDEIGELQPQIQLKLLDFLENKRFMSVGDVTKKTVDTRIITATNKNIEELVKENKFRDDLFWRINGITQTIPALRERRHDILPIATFYLNEHNKKYQQNKSFSNKVIDALTNYDWPGNVRQLRNAVDYMAVMSLGNIITDDKLPEQILNFINENELVHYQRTFELLIEDYKKKIIQNYHKIHPQISDFAETLGLSQATAYRLIGKYVSKN
ncbi:sigma-54 interaction domain-containing protein [Acetobacterium tundrae]|uniref:AAA domain-containing protein n=1 Tax=Acetobacterium tundrae TaxID=132932 RepID=A0ABR6WPU3_9FIRM|nr:sigma 54-interacting transcriptional regulator [Acetobacterium tundrae]MBC3798518.1 AAA domain-containing protein [Acetobacterium tundrae]